MKPFRVWLENIEEEELENIVLDRLGLSEEGLDNLLETINEETINNLLSLGRFKENKSEIELWIEDNKDKTVKDLIDHLSQY